MNLLHIDSSITGDHSVSRAVSAEIVATLVAANPNLNVSRRDLVANPLPHLTLDILGAPEGTPELAEFLASDILVIGTGMYNLTIPTQLKAWIDRITIAGQTFRYTAEGPVGLAGDKKVFVALSRGGYYGEGQPAAAFEHAESYLRTALAFIGIHNPTFVITEGVAIDAETREKALNAALQQARELLLPA